MAIPLYRPHFKRKDLESALSTLAVDAVANGEQSRQLIKDLAQLFSCEGGLAIRDQERSSELALRSLQLAPGSKVAISVLAPARWLRAIERVGLEPVFFDVARDRVHVLNADSHFELQDATPAYDALILYHHFGLRQGPGTIKSHHLIEDFSEGFLLEPGPLPSDLVLLSLEADSLVTGGGGSIVLAKSKPELQNLGLLLHEYDQSIRLSDLNASLARTQILDLGDKLSNRKSLASLYLEALKDSRHRSFETEGDSHPQSAFPILVQSSINEVVAYAQKKNLETARAFSDSILARGLVAEGEAKFVNALSIMMRTLLFPLHSFITAKESQEICRIFSTLP